MTDTPEANIAVRLADALGAADHAARELHTLLLVYGSQMPIGLVNDLTRLQAKLAKAAES